jgi:hypothetical protein
MISPDVYSQKKYWYHLSCTLKRKYETLIPRTNDEGFNRADHEPNQARICVSPSLEQCLVAIPYDTDGKYSLYKTINKSVAFLPSESEVFDANVSEEGWLLYPTKFIRVGYLNLSNIKTPSGRQRKIKEQVATDGEEYISQELHSWWKKLEPFKFLGQTS